MEELGINSGTNLNSTYINQVNTDDELIQTHATTLADVFNIKLQQKEKNLPQIYWIPKLHKTPYKARFIAGSRGWLLLKCSAIGIGFNGAETNCRIAHILGILLMNSCNTDIFFSNYYHL